MRSLSNIVPEIISALESAPELSGVRFLPEFKGAAVSPPLKYSAVAVGLAAVAPFEDIIGNYEGTGSGGQVYAARSSRITVRFSVYTPVDGAGAPDIDIAAGIAGVLFSGGAGYTFSGSETGEVKYDKITGALLRVMTAEMQALLEI